MNGHVLVIALVVAAVAGVRSLWSPCGLSMLSTLNPVAERGRGHRYAGTAAWFLLGSLLGGAALGAGAAAIAVLVGALHVPAVGSLLAVIVLSAIGVASDLRWWGFSLPLHPRQVDETWTVTYRRWVYAGGYGLQIGVGLATYIMTAAVYLTVALAGLTADPLAALAVGVLFGAVRGLAVLIGALNSSPERMRRIHERLDRLAPSSKRLAVLTQAWALLAAGGLLAGSWVPAAVASAAVLFLVAATVRADSAARSGSTRAHAPAASDVATPAAVAVVDS